MTWTIQPRMFMEDNENIGYKLLYIQYVKRNV